MASLQENVQTIKDSVTRMKVAAELPVTATLEELTTKIEEGVGGSSATRVVNISVVYGDGYNMDDINVTNASPEATTNIMYGDEYTANGVDVNNITPTTQIETEEVSS